MGKDTGKKFAIGAIAAAATGYIAGILTAPKSGKETRSDVKKAAAKALTEGEKMLKEAHSELKDLIAKAEKEVNKLTGAAKTELTKKIDVAKKAQSKAREVLTALHDGDADDKELKAAVKDAKAARDHIKLFFKK